MPNYTSRAATTDEWLKSTDGNLNLQYTNVNLKIPNKGSSYSKEDL